MLIKKIADQSVSHNPFCGKLIEILTRDDYHAVGVAVAENIQITHAHYHLTFDEIYFLLEGSVTLELYDPQESKKHKLELVANELCVITKGIHHKISQASTQNRLCVISHLPFHPDDEYPSDFI